MIIQVISVLIVISLFSYLGLLYLRRKTDLQRTLKLGFFKITIPKKDSDMDEKRETLKDFKEAISLMEQLLSSLKSIQSSKYKKRIL
jgi:hypothetical protein